jgi:hypothetical protein
MPYYFFIFPPSFGLFRILSMERVIPAVGDLSFGFRANAAGPMSIGTTGAAFFMRSILCPILVLLPSASRFDIIS